MLPLKMAMIFGGKDRHLASDPELQHQTMPIAPAPPCLHMRDRLLRAHPLVAVLDRQHHPILSEWEED